MQAFGTAQGLLHYDANNLCELRYTGGVLIEAWYDEASSVIS